MASAFNVVRRSCQNAAWRLTTKLSPDCQLTEPRPGRMIESLLDRFPPATAPPSSTSCLPSFRGLCKEVLNDRDLPPAGRPDGPGGQGTHPRADHGRAAHLLR